MQMCDTRILCAITTSSLSFARAYLPIQISPFLIFFFFSYFWRNSRVKWKEEKIKNTRDVWLPPHSAAGQQKPKHFSSSSSDLQSRACALTFFFRLPVFHEKNRQKVPAEREADQTFRSRNRPTEICQNEEEETFLAATAGHPGRKKKNATPEIAGGQRTAAAAAADFFLFCFLSRLQEKKEKRKKKWQRTPND